MKYMHPESPEYAEAQQAKEADARAKRANEVANERRKWRDAKTIYEQTLQLVEAIWGDRLDAAQQAQRALAEEMRDRDAVTVIENTDNAPPVKAWDVTAPRSEIFDRGIPVPLFTPRDRLQFLKEATTAFLIFGEKRGLQALPKETPTEQPEAVSGADESSADLDAAILSAGTE